MTVKDMMEKYNKAEHETRVYVKELQTEEYRDLGRYYNSEVLDVYDHNGDMVCTVEEAR